MKERAPIKGAVSGVPLAVEADCFPAVEGVCRARRLRSHREGKEQESSSVLLEF